MSIGFVYFVECFIAGSRVSLSVLWLVLGKYWRCMFG